MKKKSSINIKILKISILLLITLFIIIAFLGVYTLRLNKLTNIIPNYNYGIDIEGSREFNLTVDTSEEEKEVYVDENNNIAGEVKEDSEGNKTQVDGYTIETLTVKANEDESLIKENYEETKSIIEKRIKDLGILDYKIRLDRQNGNIIIELEQNEDTDTNYSLITTLGKFEVKDYQNGIVLMDNKNVKSVNAVSNQSMTGNYSIYLQVEFDKDGTDKLKEISKKYVATTTEDGEENINYITIELDGETLYTTYFNEEWTSKYIYIPVIDEISDQEQLNEAYESASKVANIINSGKLPIVYTLQSDNFIKSEITDTQINIFKYSIVAVLFLILIVLTIIYKTKGLMAGFANIGFVSVFSLILKYLNIEITISGIVSLFFVIVLNTIFSIIILKDNKKDNRSFLETFKKYNLSIFPVILLALIFTLTSNINTISMGMILFWGIIVFEIYNITILKILLEK